MDKLGTVTPCGIGFLRINELMEGLERKAARNMCSLHFNHDYSLSVVSVHTQRLGPKLSGPQVPTKQGEGQLNASRRKYKRLLTVKGSGR